MSNIIKNIFITISIIINILFFLVILEDSYLISDTLAGRPETEKHYPVNLLGYDQVSAHTGCDSPYSKNKRHNLFNDHYRDNWFYWEGKIKSIGVKYVSLYKVGQSQQGSLSVRLETEMDHYLLKKNQTVLVLFIMKTNGNCSLSFSGERARFKHIIDLIEKY